MYAMLVKYKTHWPYWVTSQTYKIVLEVYWRNIVYRDYRDTSPNFSSQYVCSVIEVTMENSLSTAI